MTPENFRYHAAGHIAAAHLLVTQGHGASAAMIMQTVLAVCQHPKVEAPPQLVAKVAACAEAPNSPDLELLEKWFVDPLNTAIEKTGGVFANG